MYGSQSTSEKNGSVI